MATLTVRRLDDGVYRALGARAKRNNRSLEAEVREILTAQAQVPQDDDDILAKLQAFRERTRDEIGVLSDSTALIRQMRDEE